MYDPMSDQNWPSVRSDSFIYTPILRKLAHICSPDVYARNFLFRNLMRFDKRMFVKRVALLVGFYNLQCFA